MNKKVVAIIGAGPAGMFAAYELSKRKDVVVDLFERGSKVMERVCPNRDCTKCGFRENCSILCGEGGAGGFSDGKITLSPNRGVNLKDELGFKHLMPEMKEISEIYRSFYDAWEFYDGGPELPSLLEKAAVEYESYPLLFLGTEGIRKVFGRMRTSMEETGKVHFHFNNEVIDIRAQFEKEQPRMVVYTRGASQYTRNVHGMYDHVILATGSLNYLWIYRLAEQLGASLDNSGAAGIGIRLDVGKAYLAPLIEAFYDFKMYIPFTVNQQPVPFRSFCVNQDGEITNCAQPNSDIISVNGRSALSLTGRSNLCILARIPGGREYVLNTARSINKATGGLPAVQKAKRFIRASMSLNTNEIAYFTEEQIAFNQNRMPLDIAATLPYDLYCGFRQYLLKLDDALGKSLMVEDDAYIYAPEIKYHMPRWELTHDFKVERVPWLSVIGNVAGYTESISTASVMGLVAARGV